MQPSMPRRVSAGVDLGTVVPRSHLHSSWGGWQRLDLPWWLAHRRGFWDRLSRDLVLCLPTLHWSIPPVTSWPSTITASLKMIVRGFANYFTLLTMRPVLRVTPSVGRRCDAWAWSLASL